MPTIGDRIKARRKQLGFSADMLAKKIGVDRATIYRYEKNDIKKFPTTVLEPLASALHTTPAYLMGWESEFDPSTLPNYVAIKKKKIPLLGTIAAGQPILADQHVEEYLPVDDTIHADYALRIEGDSMINAGIENGDIVFIRIQDDVDDGEIAAVLIDDSTTLKRVYKYPESIQLVAENPKYRPMVFDKTNCDTCRILGLAVAVLHEF